MARGKKHTAEQIVSLLRQIEVGVANGKTTVQACKDSTISPTIILFTVAKPSSLAFNIHC